MKFLITVVILSVFCTLASNAFLFKHKFKDGCDPNPCEHKSKCILDPKNKNISTCECPDGYTGVHCESKTGCSKKPCKKGVCENIKHNLTLFHCTCEKGYVGDHCDTADACLKHPCSSPGSVCHLDAKLKAVCDCPTGFVGKKCDKRNCTIVEFKAKNFASKPKMLVDSEVMKKWTDLDGLAHLCGVKIQPIRTFSHQLNVSSTKIEYKDYPFYTGRGLQFEVLDTDGKLLCNSICLGKNPIPMKGAKCFIDGLLAIGWKYSVLYPGVINDGSHMYTEGASLKEYHKTREFKQIGCKDLKV